MRTNDWRTFARRALFLGNLAAARVRRGAQAPYKTEPRFLARKWLITRYFHRCIALFYMKRMFGYGKVRYRGLHRNAQRIALLPGFANLLIAERSLAA